MIKEYKKQKSVDLYKKGKVSLSEAAKIADVNIYEMIDLLIKAGIKNHQSICVESKAFQHAKESKIL